MINALTIDVEDYRNLHARDLLGVEGPPTQAVVQSTRRLLELLERRQTRATFFVLGEVAAAHPQLIRAIASGGHELGVHGYYHRQLFRLTPEAFRKEVADAKAVLQEVSGQPVLGHRAPAFSITPETSWGLAILAEEGFRYDSSIFPIRGRNKGWAGFPPDIHAVKLAAGQSIVEAPLSTVSILGTSLPTCGGGYIRHFPYWVTRWAMRRVQRERPAIVYLHPYDLDDVPFAPDLRTLPFGKRQRARVIHWKQMRNRLTVSDKLTHLLDEFRFTTLSDIVRTKIPSW